MTISIGNIKDAEFSEQQKKNSPGYQAATGDLFKSNVTGGQTYANSINVLKGNNADVVPGTRINEIGQVSNQASEGNFRDQFPDTRTRIDNETKERLRRYSKKRRGGVLRYPLEALTEHTDYLQIDIEEYVPIGDKYVSAPGDDNRYVKGNFITNRAGRRSANRLSTKPLVNAGTILLPIPSNLSDSNNVQYGDSRLNGLAAVGVEAAEGVMTTDLTQGLSGTLEQLGKVRKQTSETLRTGTSAGAALNVLNKALASEAVNIFGGNVTVNDLLSRSNGEILNPNMELLFNNVTLRNFRFQFKLTPRNEKESKQVKLIIRAFKRNMAAQAQGGVVGSGNFFLKTPNVFKLRYRTGRKNHPFLNRFKQCFLTDMQTTYTGEGVYATYDDGTPVSMLLDLSFKEIQPIYDIDYDERPGTEAVGY